MGQRRHLLRRLTAFAAIAALFVSSSVYLLHAHQGDAVPQSDLKCELCLHFSTSAGTVPAPAMTGAVTLVLWLIAACGIGRALPTPRARSHQARAPPARS